MTTSTAIAPSNLSLATAPTLIPAPEPTHTRPDSSTPSPTEEEDAENEQKAQATPTGHYTAFSDPDKKLIILAAALAAFFSPLAANIYVPALNTFAEAYNVSYSLINLTVTTYLIFQGIAPTFISTISDDLGRRPSYILSFVLYMIANLALALQRSYPALLILRMLQSAGSSPTVALASGVIADITTPAERGVYVGLTSVPGILGPSLSPILGGLLSQYASWPWIFWFLLILSGTFFVPFVWFFPETGRYMVGDGSVPPVGMSHSVQSYLRARRMEREVKVETDVHEKQAVLKRRRKVKFPSPMRTLRIVFTKLGGIILVSSGILFICFYSVTVALPKQFAARYGFDDILVSVMFLPLAGGMVLSAFVRGRVINNNYMRHARRLNLPLDRKKLQDLSNFPIERARIEVALPLMGLGVGVVIGFGWSLEAGAPLAIPCVLLFIMGFTLMAGFNTMSILMIDLHRDSPATATASNNLVRCLLGAAATAVMQPVTDAIGIGWTCTIFALLWVAWMPMLVLLMRRGPEWRRQRAERQRKEASAREKKKGDVERGDIKATAHEDEDANIEDLKK